jgi:ligand-binding sensor domain-containing protein
MQDGKVRVFTENDGMDSELIYDIGPGPHDEVWVATHHGTGRYDGTRWTFPKMGPFYRAATSLAHDANGHVFLGTDGGLFCVGDCDPDPIDSHRGLLDDAVLDITVDTRGRVWVLTDKGISIVEP